MNGLWQANVAALLAENPNLAGALQSCPGPERVLLGETAGGLRTARVKGDGSQWIYLHSSVDPVREVERLVGSLDFSHNTLIFVFGVGLGYHLEAIARRLGPFSRVVVIEPDTELFALAARECGMARLVQEHKLIFLAGETEENIMQQVDEVLKTGLIFLSSNLQFLTLPATQRLHPGFAERVQRGILRRVQNNLFEMGNDVEDTLIGLRQTVANMRTIVSSHGVNDLGEHYAGKPAIIVSAGPSLAKNVDLLAGAEGKALILCVDAALKVLLERGIKPDAMLSIERGELTYQLFYEQREIPPDIVLVGPPVISPKIWASMSGEKVVAFKEAVALDRWFDKALQKGGFPMGTSVAHVAFGLARRLGCEPIIFVGQDLAYSPEGYTHSQGTELHGKKVDLSGPGIVFVEDYNGNPIPSTEIWRNFLTWLEKEIARTPAVCIDATEGGARIRGTEIMPLQQALDKYCAHNDIRRLNEVLKSRPASGELQAYGQVAEMMRGGAETFAHLREEARRASARLVKLERRFQPEEADARMLEAALAKLRQNDHIIGIVRRDALLMTFLQPYIGLAYLELGRIGNQVTPGTVQQNIQMQKWLFTRLQQLSQVIEAEFSRLADEVEGGGGEVCLSLA